MEFRIYHVARHAAKHNFELDDYRYGQPFSKEERDWVLDDPNLYLKRVGNELSRIRTVLDDMAYLMQQKGYEVVVTEEKIPSEEYADAYVFHKFHTRQFSYAEKLSALLESHSPEQIDLKISKAMRQLNVLLAAREDLLVTKVRFEAYAKSLAEQN